MRKGFKKLIAVAAASVMAAGALSLAACGEQFVPPTGVLPAGNEVVSNGGFVVQKGNYYYFINGIESYTGNNDYGTPVKGALMRIKTEDVAKKSNTAETVVPSLMVAGDYDAGLFIYGDRLYYATPTNVKDTSGVVQSSYLDFKSVKLDGTDIHDEYRLESNSTPYRFVQVKDSVYLLYVTDNDIHSRCLSTGKDVVLASGVSAYLFNAQDKTDPYVYYTMPVTDYFTNIEEPYSFDYTQVYRVCADATIAPEGYTYRDESGWDMDYVNSEMDGELPYVNLGEIVLDGWGGNYGKTALNHGSDPKSPFGYTYTLQSYENGGLYFTRKQLTDGASVGEADSLYYLDCSKLTASWDSVAGNDNGLDVIAQPVNTSKASSSALFYKDEEGTHHYLYVENGVIYRATVGEDGNNVEEQAIAFDVSGASLVSIDMTTSDTYDYVYFTRSNGAGRSVERAVFNGEPVYYENLPYEDVDNKPYQPVKVLNIEHADSWYEFELIGTDLFFCNADDEIASTSYNYINTVSLKNAEGKLMDNAELAAFTEKYDAIMSTDAETGLLARLNAHSNIKLSTAIKYFFYTGSDEAFTLNLKEAKDAGKKDTYLYTAAEQDAFYAFAGNEGYKQDDTTLFEEGEFVEDGVSYRKLSAFTTAIGKMTDADKEAQETYWRGALEHYVDQTATTEEGLPAWAWALIGIAIGVVVLGGAGLAVWLVLRKKKTAAPAPERLAVDTTDDRSVDVYAQEPEEQPVEETEQPEEQPVEETEQPEETPSEPTDGE